MRMQLISLALISISVPAHADYGYGWCNKPIEPYCLEQSDINDTCRYEVETYVNAIDTYIDCVTKGALSARKKAIDKWNCRVSGHSAGNCY